MESTNEQQYQYALEADRSRYQQSREADLAGQQGEQTNTAKMGWAFFLFLLVVCLILDVIDAFTAGTIGWLTGIVGDIFLAAVTGMTKSGRKQFGKILTGLIGESIPIIGFLPLRTGFLIWGFVSSRSAVLQEVSGALPGGNKTKAALQGTR